jgi:hypothetical protein
MHSLHTSCNNSWRRPGECAKGHVSDICNEVDIHNSMASHVEGLLAVERFALESNANESSDCYCCIQDSA